MYIFVRRTRAHGWITYEVACDRTFRNIPRATGVHSTEILCRIQFFLQNYLQIGLHLNKTEKNTIFEYKSWTKLDSAERYLIRQPTSETKFTVLNIVPRSLLDGLLALLLLLPSNKIATTKCFLNPKMDTCSNPNLSKLACNQINSVATYKKRLHTFGSNLLKCQNVTLKKKDVRWGYRPAALNWLSPLSYNLKPMFPRCRFISWTAGYSPINDIYTHVDTSSILAVRIFCEMPGTYFAYQNPLFSSLTPNPPSYSRCCRFSPVNNFARTVECTSPWTFYGTCFIRVRAFLSPAIFMLSCPLARARARDQSFPPTVDIKKRKKKERNRSSQQRSKGNLEFAIFAFSTRFLISPSPLTRTYVRTRLIKW